MNPLDRAFFKAYAKHQTPHPQAHSAVATATSFAPARSAAAALRGEPVGIALAEESRLLHSAGQTYRLDPPHFVSGQQPSREAARAAGAPEFSPPAMTSTPLAEVPITNPAVTVPSAAVGHGLTPTRPATMLEIARREAALRQDHAHQQPAAPQPAIPAVPDKAAVASLPLEQVAVGSVAPDETMSVKLPIGHAAAARATTAESEAEYRLQVADSDEADELGPLLAVAAGLRMPHVLPLPATIAERRAAAELEPAEHRPAHTSPLQDAGKRNAGDLVSRIAATPAEKLRADWEVDRFAWPSICEQLLDTKTNYFGSVGQRMADATADRHQVLLVTGTRRGEGRTTLALCLARCAATAGVRVALLDADLQNPQLGSRLGMETPCGWWEAVEHQAPLHESAIASLEDGITLFPQTVPHSAAAGDPRSTAVLERISAHFPLVIIDAGPLDGDATPPFVAAVRSRIDAALVVRDLRFCSQKKAHEVAQRLLADGLAAVGIAENFKAA